MAKIPRAGVWLLLLSCLASPSAGQELAKPKATVEFRWIEPQILKGVTEEKGHPIVCGGKDWYAHLKPVLTNKDIATARLTHLRLGEVEQHGVEFTLAPGAVKKLTDACGDAPGRWVTVYHDGRWWGASYLEKARPGNFSPPMAGFMLSKAAAEQIVEASK